MHASTEQREAKTSTPARDAGGAGSGSRGALQTQLRTMSYADGAARLAPVQMETPEGGTKAAAEGAPDAETTGRDFDVEAKLVRDKYEAYAIEAGEFWGLSTNDVMSVICMEADKKKWETENDGDVKGLMQMKADAWAAVIKDYGHMTLPGESALISSYDYATYVLDPKVSIHFGTAYLGIAAGYAQSKFPDAEKNLIDPNDRTTQLIAYNAGPGNAANLIKKAKALGYKDPSEPSVFTQEAVVRAVWTDKIETAGKDAGKTAEQIAKEVAAADTAIAKKCTEIAAYYLDAPKYKKELEKLDAEEGPNLDELMGQGSTLVEGDGTKGTSRVRAVKDLRLRLRALGFDRPALGHFDDSLSASVGSAQRAIGLPQTGQVDQETWSALRLKSKESFDAAYGARVGHPQIAAMDVARFNQLRAQGGKLKAEDEQWLRTVWAQLAELIRSHGLSLDAHPAPGPIIAIGTFQYMVGLNETQVLDQATWDLLRRPVAEVKELNRQRVERNSQFGSDPFLTPTD